MKRALDWLAVGVVALTGVTLIMSLVVVSRGLALFGALFVWALFRTVRVWEDRNAPKGRIRYGR